MSSGDAVTSTARLRDADTAAIDAIWRRWGLPIVSIKRSYLPSDVRGLLLTTLDGQDLGLVTWAVGEHAAEIVTLDAFPPGRGAGARLLAAAEQRLGAGDVERVFLVTTSDNPRALHFYLRHGYRLRRVHLDAMLRVRRIKPELPTIGREGIALRDVWELDKTLGAADADPPALPQHVLTIVAVRDVERSAQFYEAALGWRVVVRVPVYVELEAPDGQRFGVYERDGFANNTGVRPHLAEPGAISATEIYLRCDELEAAIARLERAGARLLSANAPRPWGDEAAYFADPDGNVIVVSRPLATP